MRALKMWWYRIVGSVKEAVGDHTRYGVVGSRGRTELVGFVSESHAHTEAIERGIGPYVVFEYDNRRRLLPAVQRSRWTH